MPQFDAMKRICAIAVLIACTLSCYGEEGRRYEVLGKESGRGVLKLLPVERSTDAEVEAVSFKVTAGDYEIYAEGDIVRGVPTSPSNALPKLEKIWPAEPRAEARMAAVNAQLHKDTLRRGKKAFRGIGERLPRFALYNQTGKLVEPEQLRGNYVVLNFIFTRCMAPEMCPASSRKMGQLQMLAKEAGIENFRLVTVSFDPGYDTPGVLYAYGKLYEFDKGNFDLLTGPEEAIDDLMKQMGVLVYDDVEQIYRHTMQTTLVGPDGKLVYRIPSPSWSPQDFMRKLEELTGGADES